MENRLTLCRQAMANCVRAELDRGWGIQSVQCVSLRGHRSISFGLTKRRGETDGELRNRRQASVTSPPLGGVSECFPGRSSDLQAQPYWPDFPGAIEAQCRFGFRTCLPLRGSSGFSPDSLFTPEGEGPRNVTTISSVYAKCNPYRLWISCRCRIGLLPRERNAA